MKMSILGDLKIATLSYMYHTYVKLLELIGNAFVNLR
jgi:hypothetical protein